MASGDGCGRPLEMSQDPGGSSRVPFERPLETVLKRGPGLGPAWKCRANSNHPHRHIVLHAG